MENEIGIPLFELFTPELDVLMKDDRFMDKITGDVISLCAMATVHTTKIFKLDDKVNCTLYCTLLLYSRYWECHMVVASYIRNIKSRQPSTPE